jgi:hypothetical protein
MKDWSNIPDEEFDDVFRDISLNNNEDVWPGAWPIMEEKLNEDKRKRRVLVLWRSAAALLILGTLGIFSIAYFKKDKLKDSVSQLDSPTQATTPVKERTSKSLEVDEKNGVNLHDSVTIASRPAKNRKEFTLKIPKNVQINEKKISKTSSISGQKQEITGSLHKQTALEEKRFDEILSLPQESISKKTENKEPKKQTSHNHEINQIPQLVSAPKNAENVGKIETQETVSVREKTKPEVSFFSEDTVVVLASNPEPILIHSETGNDSEAKSKEKPRIYERFALNFGISPDYSKVNNNTFGRMGHNYQFIIDYKITSKLSLRTGIIQSLKLYDAYPKDYVWPVKWDMPSSPLKEVTATCKMIDIPVALSYQLLEKGSNKFYTTVGITNYKMMNEKYEYWYDNDADPNLKLRKWEGSTGFISAGVVNMSLGLERKLTNFLSVQVEPFVKIPVKNVGLGSVKLLTTGLFLNVKTYAPRKKMQPK